ncbi:uncharacterized protein [Diadema antillarum]|uniref:uncharacterized protein n=1 Tax=Diadema antillarum TaxID=105358 RepID=UPI003A8896F5
MSRDWERNLTSTLRETEDNLSRMRNRLDPTRHKPIDSSLMDAPPDYGSSNGYPAMRQGSSRKERPVSAVYGSMSSPSYELYRHSTPSTGLVALLSEKVERQNKTIEQLSHKIHSLENDRRKDEIRVRDLEQQVNELSGRLQGHRGHENDRDIESWQRDIRSRLDELHERITKQMLGGIDAYHSEGALASLTRDLHEMKRSLQSECDALHHEIETLRSRMVKQEMDTTGQLVDTKELGRRMDRLDRKFTKLSSDVQFSQSHGGRLSPGIHQGLGHPQHHSTQKDVRDLKSEMTKLLSTFSKLESASQVSHSSSKSNPSTISTTTASSSGKSKRRRAYPSSSAVHRTSAPLQSSLWQRRSYREDAVNSESSTSLEDLTSSEVSLPLNISQELLGEEEGDGRKGKAGDAVKSDQIEDDLDDHDDYSLSLSDLEGSQKDGDFGSALSLDSDQLDSDLI